MQEPIYSDIRTGLYERLMETFKDCAPLSIPAPRNLVRGRAGAELLTHEVWLQTREGLTALLYNHYDAVDGILGKNIHVSDRPIHESGDRVFCVSLCSRNLSIADRKTIAGNILRFQNNLAASRAEDSGVFILSPIEPDLMALRYHGNRLFWVLHDMIDQHHPNDRKALSHHNTAYHITGRLRHDMPGYRLI